MSQAALGSFIAEIAGGLVGHDVTAFEDTGPLDDPFGIAAETLAEMFIGHHGIGHIAAGAHDAKSCETAAARAERIGTVRGHDQLSRGGQKG